MNRALPIYYALLMAIATVAALYLLLQLRHVLVLLFISVLFAAAVARPAEQLERLRIPRAVAAILVYLASLAIFAGIGWLVLPPLARQIGSLGEDLPAYVERYEQLRDRYEKLREQYPGLRPFDSQVSELSSTIISDTGARLTSLVQSAFALFLDLLSVFVISMLLITNRERLMTFTLSLIAPRYRERTRDVITKMWRELGHYLRAKLIVMVIIAALTYVALLLIGVPYPLLLAIVVGLGEAIPRIGPWLARIPLLGIAALEGWSTLGITFGASVIIENAKGYAISPFVEGQQLDIHPLLVFISVLVGAALLGVAGAFIAVPAAAIIEILFQDVIRPWHVARINRGAIATDAPPAAR